MATKLRPYPAMKESGVSALGVIPKHWDATPLGRLGRITKGNGGSKADEVPQGVPCVRYGDLYTKYEFFIESVRSFVSPERAPDYTPIHYGDVLFAGSGETIEDIGRSAINLLPSGAVCGGDIVVFRPSRVLAPRFLGYAADCRYTAIQKARMGRGFTVVHIYGNELRYLWLPIPPLDEQAVIARFLDHVDRRIRRLITSKHKLIELLEEQKKAIIHRAVTRGLDHNVSLKPSGVEWLGKVPQHWSVKRLRHVGDALIGVTFEPNDVVDEEEGLLVLRASNVSGGRIVYKDNLYIRRKVPERLITRAGDILICSRSGSRSLIGKNARIEGEAVGVTFGTFMTIFRSQYSDYLTWVFNSRLFEHQSGMFLTSTINQLTISSLYNFTVPLPPKEEQIQITQYLQNATAQLSRAADRARREIDLLREYRSRLIADVVTGKFDVRDKAAQLPEGVGEPESPSGAPAIMEVLDDTQDVDSALAEAEQ